MKMTNFETLIEKRMMKKKIMIVLVSAFLLLSPAEVAIRQIVQVNKTKR